MITGKYIKYLIPILNSKLLSKYIKIHSASLGEGIYGAKIYIELCPIPKISIEDQKPFIDLTEKILKITSADDYDPKNPLERQKYLEEEIDLKVYKLYNLTYEEIKEVDPDIDSVLQKHNLDKTYFDR